MLNLVIIHSIWVRNLVPEGVSVKACSDRQRVLIFDLGLIMIGLLAIYFGLLVNYGYLLLV